MENQIIKNQIYVDVQNLMDDLDEMYLDKDIIRYFLNSFKAKAKKTEDTKLIKLTQDALDADGQHLEVRLNDIMYYQEIEEQERMEEEEEAERDELLHHQNYEASVCEI